MDSRNFDSGAVLTTAGYCDQPYVVKGDDGTWVCVMTTGGGSEGHPGQHVVSATSLDQGRTWSPPVDVEPRDGPEASWAMPLKVPYGRIYVFYTYNDRNMRSVISDYGATNRVDTLGAFVFRYSDDNGRTWSSRRHTIPVRKFRIDLENPYRGDVCFWWGVSKPIIHGGAAYIGFSKVGHFGEGFMAQSEGAFLKSVNVLTERNPEAIEWETLPDGEVGLRSPEGPVSDEQNLVGLNDGSLYCTYRTITGWSCGAYSRDGGHTWTAPAFAVYTPNGRRFKHPRAANFVRKRENGKYIYWFHNNSTRWYNTGATAGNRNVAWLSGGTEREGFIHWSQPEIALYNEDFHRGSSYPDFIEEGGRFFIISTQKTSARTVEVDPELLAGLWAQTPAVAEKGLILDAEKPQNAESVANIVAPLDEGGSFSVDLWVRVAEPHPGAILVENPPVEGRGFSLTVGRNAGIHFEMSDGWQAGLWESDPEVLATPGPHHIVLTVDGGPKVITYVIDGSLCDGGPARPFGWGRFSRSMKQVWGSAEVRFPAAQARILHARIYNRYLRTNEAVANFEAERPQRLAAP